MELVLQDSEGTAICTMEDHLFLSFYGPQDGYGVYVIDLNPDSILKEIEDVSQI